MLLEYAVLLLAGLVAGWVNAVAGAGSLLTLPALVFTGLDAGSANATNRVAVLFQSIASVVAYERGGVRAGRFVLAIALPAAGAAVAGAWVATLLDERQLRLAIGVAMVVFLALSFVQPRRGDEEAPPAGEAQPAPTPPRFHPAMLFGFAAIGFYAGFLQAGVGILILLYLSLAHASDLVAANAVKVGLVAVVALVSIVTFTIAGERIDLLRGGVLAVATIVGGYLGARATLKKGERLVRAAVVLAVVASAVKLVVDAL